LTEKTVAVNLNLMQQNKIRVFIADSQPLFRHGVKSQLSQHKEVDICGESALTPQLITEIETAFPSVVLLGITDENDFEMARLIKQRFPGTGVVILTSKHDDSELYQAIRARSVAYVNRNITVDDLIDIIHRTVRGEHPINDALFSNPHVADKVLRQFQDLSWGRGVEEYISPLTPREAQVLGYIAKGYLNKQIASELFLSEQTIKNHVTSILRKLDANARTQAVVNAIKRGLIDVRENKPSST
jgi:DNA-binding NarL/FixJ family response regulator